MGQRVAGMAVRTASRIVGYRSIIPVRGKEMINPVKIVLGPILAIAAFMSAEWTAMTFLPLNTWFEYRSISVEGDVPDGGPIKVKSSIVRHRISDMRYNDVLFCRFDYADNFILYSTSASQYDGAPPMDGISQWAYAGNVPITHATCYIRSSVTVALKYGIQKTPQVIMSNQFKIGEPHGNP